MELAELLKYLGIDETKTPTLDEFKQTFDGEFIRRSSVKNDKELSNEIIGKRIGSLETKIKSLAKKAGIEISDGETKDKTIEEIAELVIKKAETTVADLKKQVDEGGKVNTDEKVVKLETEINRLKSESTDWKSKFETVGGDFENYKKNIVTETRNQKLNSLKEKAFSGIKFKPGISEFEREGFAATVEKNFKFDLDESGENLVVVDKEGKPISNPKVAGKVFTPSELLETKAIEGKIYHLNENGGKSTGVVTTQQQTAGGQQTFIRPINPAAQSNA